MPAGVGLSPSRITKSIALLRSIMRPPCLRSPGTPACCTTPSMSILRGIAISRARARLAVGSALFGLARARRSDTRIPAVCDIEAPRATDPGISLASGAGTGACSISRQTNWWSTYVQVPMPALPAARRTRRRGRRPGDGHGTVVNHFNKAHKGRLSRALVSSRTEPDDPAEVAAIARRAGMRVERDGNDLTVVVSAGLRQLLLRVEPRPLLTGPDSSRRRWPWPQRADRGVRANGSQRKKRQEFSQVILLMSVSSAPAAVRSASTSSPGSATIRTPTASGPTRPSR